MNRTNLILLGVFVVVITVWALTSPDDGAASTSAAPRLFPQFNREAVDRIVIDGGWKGTKYEFERLGGNWSLASGGGYPVQGDKAENFVDAIASIRRDNLIGTSEALRRTSRTGDGGRKVTVYRQDEKMAEFVIGKQPKSEYSDYFLRKEDEDKIYRARTVSDKDASVVSLPGPYGPAGPRSFNWDRYSDDVSQWVDTKIWNLDDGEVVALDIERPGDKFAIRLVREEEGKWAIVEEGKEKVAADTAAVEAITNGLSYLAFEEVVGAFGDQEARTRYGFGEAPAITLVLTLRKKVEKKPEEKKDPEKKDPEKKEGDEEKKDEEKKPDEPEYTEFKRVISVGHKVKLARSFDEEKGEPKEEEFYAVKTSGELSDRSKAAFIYLVNDYKIGPLKKSREDFVLASEEEESEEEPEKESEPEKDAETEPDKDSEKEPEGGAEEPEKAEPEKTEPEKTEPDPKEDEPGKEEPK